MGFWEWLNGEEPGLIDQWLHSDDPGHFGEYLIDYALNTLPGYSKKLCNVYLPYKGRTSEIDVIMLHETGIYVFESKNYSGWIFGDEKSQYWTQCLNAKTKNRFYNPIMQNHTHIKALQEYLNLKGTQRIFSYIIFSQRCELKKISNSPENITVVRRPDMLKALKNRMKNLLAFYSREQIDEMYEKLLPLIDVTEEEKTEHIKQIEEIKPTIKKKAEPPAKEETVPICPKCGAQMILRTASKGANKGKQFYGCPNFPKCRSIININNTPPASNP